MFQTSLIAIALLVTTPALAKDVTLTLNDEEQKAFLALLDSALKTGGLASLQPVIKFVQKYRAAVGPVSPAPTPTPAPSKK